MSPRGHGLRDWLMQRMTAVYLGGFVVYVIVYFLSQPSHGYEQWRTWISQPLVAISSAGFALAILLHGWVGMRDVVFDYIHSLALRLTVLSLIGLMLVSCGFWTFRVLLRVTI